MFFNILTDPSILPTSFYPCKIRKHEGSAREGELGTGPNTTVSLGGMEIIQGIARGYNPEPTRIHVQPRRIHVRFFGASEL
jgi:hypothetical protein